MMTYRTCVSPEDKLKQQQSDATKRENILVMKLASKDKEIQDYVVSIHLNWEFYYCHFFRHADSFLRMLHI